MSSRIWRRTLPVVLALALLPGAASAGLLGRGAEPALRSAGLEGLFARAWEALAGLWEQAGATIDPHGLPVDGGGSAGPSGATTDEDKDAGNTIDPHG